MRCICMPTFAAIATALGADDLSTFRRLLRETEHSCPTHFCRATRVDDSSGVAYRPSRRIERNEDRGRPLVSDYPLSPVVEMELLRQLNQISQSLVIAIRNFAETREILSSEGALSTL